MKSSTVAFHSSLVGKCAAGLYKLFTPHKHSKDVLKCPNYNHARFHSIRLRIHATNPSKKAKEKMTPPVGYQCLASARGEESLQAASTANVSWP